MQIPFEYTGMVIMGIFAVIGLLFVLICWGACVIADQVEKSQQAGEDARNELLRMAKDRGWK